MPTSSYTSGGGLSRTGAGVCRVGSRQRRAGRRVRRTRATTVLDDYVPYLVYLAFAEGTLSGMLITLLVVYRPQWVATFDDLRYLKRQ